MGIDTPVLDTGVSSVELIRLKSASEKAFNIADIPIVAIMTNTTIRSLASAIRQILTSQYKVEYNPVVTLQYNGSKTPLWLIHPGIGEILVFLGLVQYFPDRPIHALRACGFNKGEEPFQNLTDAVTTYYHELKCAMCMSPAVQSSIRIRSLMCGGRLNEPRNWTVSLFASRILEISKASMLP